jgi:hypothetical protein
MAKIIGKINKAIFSFYYDIDRGESYKKTELWEIISPGDNQPYEINPNEEYIKPSILGINQEVINDKFNKEIEINFGEIYQILENELVTESKPSWRYFIFKKFSFCS